MEESITTIAVALSPVVIALSVSAKKWMNSHKKISDIRILLESVDDSLKDNLVSESEFRTMFYNFKKVVNA